MSWLICLLLTAAPADNPVVAVAGSDTLRRAELRIQLALQRETEISPENTEPVLGRWADKTLVYREALARGFGSDETSQAILNEFERQYVITLMSDRIVDTVTVGNTEVYDYYNRRKLDFTTRLRFQYMVLPDENTAKLAVAELKTKDFKAVAAERSLDRANNPSAETLCVGRADTLLGLDPLLEDTIFTLTLNKVSAPIRVSNTWWLIKPVANTPIEGAVTLEQARTYITRLLELKHRKVALERAIAAMRKKAKVAVKTPPKTDTLGVLATVNDARLTRRYLKLQLPEKTELDDKDLPRLSNIWIEAELLNQEGRRLSLAQDDTSQILFREKRKDYVTDLYLKNLLSGVTVPPNEVFDYFERRKDDYLNDVRILHVLVPTESAAAEIMAEVKKGTDFAKLAKERSLDRAASQGKESGLLDRLDRNMNIDAGLEATIWGLKVGEISPLIRTSEGFWIVKVTDRKKVRNEIEFKDAKSAVERFLYQQKSRGLLDAKLAELKKAQPVQFMPGSFWN